MTSPQPGSTLTYQEALAAATAARATQTFVDTVAATVTQLSESVISARENAADWAQTLILGLWRDVDPYSGADVQDFTEKAGGYLRSAQTVTARTAAVAQARILQSMGVRLPSAAATPSNPEDVRGEVSFDDDGSVSVDRGTSRVDYADGPQVVDLDEDATTVGIFNRPARTQRYLESQGMDREQARQAAEQRVVLLVDDNLMQAQRLAEAEVLAKTAIDTGVVDLDGRRIEAVPQQVIGYRRVIHPELSRTGVCGLCIAAADRVYRVRQLLPIHDRCKCTIAAVTAEFDPADVLNQADIGAVYGTAGGTSGPELKRVRYQVDEHGEFGPTLAPKRAYKPRKQAKAAARTNDAPRRRSGVRL